MISSTAETLRLRDAHVGRLINAIQIASNFLKNISDVSSSAESLFPLKLEIKSLRARE